ncbi:MAG: SusC/RagA family TonB-linked outer membrane protein, partial [Tannerella sp.]|nr:SusC/RagA family TonB-linked outer membrane protein [Tannerella sp.]
MKFLLRLTFLALLWIGFMALPVKVWAQQTRTVSGIVLDENEEPVIGANVIVPGASVGTTTGVDGDFRLAVPDGYSTLQVSYLGYQTQTVTVGSQNSYTVRLEVADRGLDEVVVIGYGTVRKRDLTGAVSSIKSEDIVLRPGPNPMEALQGKVAGLDITRTSGQAGAGVDMQLRGVRSFTASGTPLFLIDGLPGSYETLNANDIESIEVLKDASSTAVYGSAGANGVIIITTKNGSAGKVNVDLNTYIGYNGWSITPEMRTGDSYVQAKRDAYSYNWDANAREWTKTGALWQSPADDKTIFGDQRYALFQEGQWTDWTGIFMRTNAATQNYSLSVRGGNEKTKGYISFNYTDELGQYYGDDYKLYSTSMRIEHSPWKWLTVGSNLQGSYVVRNSAQDKLENALTTDPLVRTRDADGNLVKDLGNNVYNLLYNYQPGVYENLYHNARVNVNPFIEIKPLKGLSFLSRWGIWFTYNNHYQFEGIGSVNEVYTHNNNAIAEINQNRSYGYQWDNILTYNFTLNQDHDFTLTGATSWYDSQNMESWLIQEHVPYNTFKWYNMQRGVNTSGTTGYDMSKTMAYIGRINYSYRSKYLASASVRYDGASALYESNRWDIFPAASAAWRISEENFMASTKGWLNDLKLRVGWGVTGSARIDPYSSVNTLESFNVSLGGLTQAAFRNSQFVTNTGLGWEKSYNTNIGLDATLIKNRVSLTMDYYITKTKGVIWAVSLPATSGLYLSNGTQFQTNMNLAETKNNGFEMTLNTRNIVTKDFEWNSTLVFSTNKEEILKLTGATANFIGNGSTGFTLALGEPVNSFWNYKIDGVWQIGQEKDA